MTKKEFLEILSYSLSALNKSDKDERLNFYAEMIEDRIEEGYSEEDAVGSVGDPEVIGAQILSEYSYVKKASKKTSTKRKLHTWEIVLLAVGSPVWVPLAIAAAAIVFTLYVVFWAVVGSIWAAPVSLSAVGLAGLSILPAIYFIQGNLLGGIAIIGLGVFSAGLAIFAFYGCIKATKGGAILTKKTVLGIRSLFVGK